MDSIMHKHKKSKLKTYRSKNSYDTNTYEFYIRKSYLNKQTAINNFLKASHRCKHRERTKWIQGGQTEAR